MMSMSVAHWHVSMSSIVFLYDLLALEGTSCREDVFTQGF